MIRVVAICAVLLACALTEWVYGRWLKRRPVRWFVWEASYGWDCSAYGPAPARAGDTLPRAEMHYVWAPFTADKQEVIRLAREQAEELR